MYEAGENDEISIIAIAFNTNEPNYVNNLNLTIHRHNTKYAMMKFQQMSLLLLPMSQKYGESSGNICVLTIHMTQICMKHGQWRIYGEDDEISKNAIVLTANEPKICGK